ncbi:MAG: AAA domain-containing protein [Promethearchaeota archaeon]
MSLEIGNEEFTYAYLWDYLTRAKNNERNSKRVVPRLIGKPSFNIPKDYSYLADLKVEKIHTIGDFRVKPGDAILATWENGEEKLFSTINTLKTHSYPKNELYGIIIDYDSKNYYISFSGRFSSQELKYCDIVNLRKVDNQILLRIQENILERIQNGESKQLRKLRTFLEEGNIFDSITPITLHHTRELLNESQQKAVGHCLNLTNDNYFFLIHGPPGTGKTTVISELVLQLFKRNQRILITSHTNIAVDNALEKIIEALKETNEYDIKQLVLRLGINAKLLPNIRPLLGTIRNFEELRSYKIVGSTLTKAGLYTLNSNFDWNNPSFDYVIIDEASMASIPLTLVGMIFGKKIVLVGDHLQLPPIFNVPIKQQLEKSLFEVLISKYPDHSIFLNTQYRSNKYISMFPSHFVYNDRLKTAYGIENIQIDYFPPNRDNWTQSLSGRYPIVWIDTHNYNGQGFEWKLFGKRYSACNLSEAALIIKIMKEYQKAGYSLEKDIAIITPFRLQATLIGRLIKQTFPKQMNNVYNLWSFTKSSTIDSYQGRENNIVIISLVDDGINPRAAKVLQDNRRINVAITRAKRKLIILASYKLAKAINIPLIAALFKYIQQYGHFSKELLTHLSSEELEKTKSTLNMILNQE